MRPVTARVARGLKAEAVIAEEWCQLQPYLGCRAKLLADYSDLDRVVFGAQEELRHFLEIKTRTVPALAYPDTIIHERKHLAAKAVLEHFKVPTFCAVVFTDGARVWRIDEPPDGYRDVAEAGKKPVPHCYYTLKRGVDCPELYAAVVARMGRPHR